MQASASHRAAGRRSPTASDWRWRREPTWLAVCLSLLLSLLRFLKKINRDRGERIGMCLVKPCACGACDSSFEPALSYILRERVVYLTTRMAVCARGWSQRPRAPERAVLGRHPSGLSPRRHGVGKKRKGERKKKAAGARVLFHHCSLFSTGCNRSAVSCGLISPN